MDIVLSQFQCQTEHTKNHEDPRFNEIDYGPDENMPEETVIARVGQNALDAWNTRCMPPPGWDIDSPALIDMWREFFAWV